MIENLPNYANIVFILATLYTIILFYKATGYSIKVLYVLLGWTALQGALGFSGFYLNFEAMPPRMPMSFVPTLILIAVLFFSKKGKEFSGSLDIKTLTLIHIVRIPVEFCLLWLFLAKSIPQAMTFEGANFDILAGLTAPVVVFFYFYRKNISDKFFLAWNIICMCLLLTIIGISLISAPMPIQQIAFDQHNVGVMYFPFVWLPSVIVPIVLYSHLVVIRRILKKI